MVQGRTMRTRVLSTTLILIAILVQGFLRATPALADGCSFVLGFKALHDLIPTIVGDCLVNEHHNPSNGDGLQETAGVNGKGGLLVWRKADNWTAYTDGSSTWVSGPNGLQKRGNNERFAWEANPDGLPVVAGSQPAPQGSSGSPSTGPGVIAFAGPDGNLWMANPDGSGLHESAQTQGPIRDITWSRDGRTLAYMSSALFLFDATSGQFRELRTTSPVQGPISFMPDGQSLVALSAAPGDTGFCSNQFVTISTSTGAVSRLVQAGCRISTLDVRPDGQHLIITTGGSDPTARIQDVSLPSGTVTTLVGPGWQPRPDLATLSLDGQALVYVQSDQPQPNTPHQLYVSRSDGTSPRLIYRFPDGLSWLPFSLSGDASQLAYTQSGKIWVIRLDGSAPRSIATGSLPAWQPVPIPVSGSGS
jgi:hypothetical protein